MVGSKQIKDDAVKSRHINDGSIKKRDLSNGVQEDLAAANKVEVATAKMSDATTIEHIGGPINANNTPLDTKLTLKPGTYLVTVDGSFFNDAGDLGADVYPQLSLWLDKNPDGEFDWQDDEGDISPNALLPGVKDRHIAVSGNTVITLDKKTDVGLVAHGYTSTQGSEGSGQITVDKALITATKIS